MNPLFNREQLRFVARVIVQRVMGDPVSRKHADRFVGLVGSHGNMLLNMRGEAVYTQAQPLMAAHPGLADEYRIVRLGREVMAIEPPLLLLPPPPLRLSGAMKNLPLPERPAVFTRLRDARRKSRRLLKKPMEK